MATTYTYTAATGGEKVIIEFNDADGMYKVSGDSGVIFNIKKDDIEKISVIINAGNIGKLGDMITVGNIETANVTAAAAKPDKLNTAEAKPANVTAAEETKSNVTAPINVETGVLSSNVNPTNVEVTDDIIVIADMYNKIITMINNAIGLPPTANGNYAIKLSEYKAILAKYNKWNDTQGSIISNITDDEVDGLSADAIETTISDTVDEPTSNANILKHFDITIQTLGGKAISLGGAVSPEAVEKFTNSLIDKGENVKFPGDRNITLLHYVSAKNNADAVDILLKNGANVNLTDADGKTPLHYAILHNADEMVTHLLDKEADVNVADKHGHTPLHYAVAKQNPEMIQYLLDKQADVTIKDEKGHSPIYYADYLKNAEIKNKFKINGFHADISENYNATKADGNELIQELTNEGNVVNDIDAAAAAAAVENSAAAAAATGVTIATSPDSATATAAAYVPTSSNVVSSPDAASAAAAAYVPTSSNVVTSPAAVAASVSAPFNAATPAEVANDANVIKVVIPAITAAAPIMSAAAVTAASMSSPPTATATMTAAPATATMTAAPAAPYSNLIQAISTYATTELAKLDNLSTELAKLDNLATELAKLDNLLTEKEVTITIGEKTYQINFNIEHVLTQPDKKYYTQLLKKQIFITVKTKLLEPLHGDQTKLFVNDNCDKLVNATNKYTIIKDTLCKVINPIIQGLFKYNNELQKAVDNQSNYAVQEQYYNNTNKLIETLRSQRNLLRGNQDANEQIDKLKEQRKTLELKLYNHYERLYKGLGDLDKTDDAIKNAERLSVNDNDMKALIDLIKIWYGKIKADHSKYRTEFYNKYKQYVSWKQTVTPGRFRGGENKTRRAKNDGKKKTRKI